MTKSFTKDTEFQAKLANQKSRTQLTMAWRAAGLAWLVLFISLIYNFYQSAQLNSAHRDVKENIKIVYVKLYPSGDHEVTFDYGEDPDRLARPQINSSFINYVTKRFQKQPETIRADYGYVTNFLGSKELEKFLNEYDAANEALELENCKTCPREEVTIRAIRHETYKKGETPTNGTIFQTTIYYSVAPRDRFSNKLGEKVDYLTHIKWSYLPMPDLLENPKQVQFLAANPLGITIIDQQQQEDLTE